MPDAEHRRSSYHHGALREELLAACLRLIETEGIGAVSLRRVAREAGVSPGAPYHHFADRGALLAAISARGFEQLVAELTRVPASPDGAARLVTSVGSYVGFARTHRAYFQLMFRPELSQPDQHPETKAAGDAAFAALTDTVTACGVEDPASLTMMLWGVGHGLASLAVDGLLDHASEQWDRSVDELIAGALRLVEASLRDPQQ